MKYTLILTEDDLYILKYCVKNVDAQSAFVKAKVEDMAQKLSDLEATQ